MKKYELLLVLPGTLDETQAKTRAGEILNIVKEVGPEAELNILGKMRLAYPVKQIRYGYFYTIVFSAEPAGVKSLQEKLGLLRDVLRKMVMEFNPGYSATQKISYVTNSIGVTTMAPSSDESGTASEGKPAPTMQEIDKKLDEILAGDLISGV